MEKRLYFPSVSFIRRFDGVLMVKVMFEVESVKLVILASHLMGIHAVAASTKSNFSEAVAT